MIFISNPLQDIVLSSDLADFTIMSQDHDFVDVRLSVDNAEVLSSRYYLNNGKVIIPDIRSLIEQQIIGDADFNTSDCLLEATADDDSNSVTFRVMYCDRSLKLVDTATWLQDNFLTLANWRRIPPGICVTLYWYAVAKESLLLRAFCTYFDEAGKRKTYQYVISGNGQVAINDGNLSQFIDFADVVSKICEANKVENITLQSVTFRLKNRSITYFIDPSLTDARQFSFFNCFGIVETISLKGITSAKIKADRSVASVGRTSMFYDASISKEYEIETAPLTSDECILIEQMLTSPSVRVQPDNYYETDFESLYPILITDFSSELSNTDEKLNTVKFTWRYADNLPYLVPHESEGVFDFNFNPVFI